MKVKLKTINPHLELRGFKVGETYDAKIDHDPDGTPWYVIDDPNQKNIAMLTGISDGTGGWTPDRFEVVEGEDK